ncbi:restriction endonuclease subunit S [Segatella bryantii]|uniref:restriction endonuclease subunit S n=1 Tax=Segatella bryantii TaxID=77095 RepID=UPI002431E153|nr:restriction endonuclease subunit S [Segatella bryantii]
MKESWLYKRLGEVASFINGYAFKPEQWTSSGTPIVRIQNLNNPDAPFNYYDGEVPDKVKIKDGDLLISWSASLGAYIWQGGDAFLNQHIFKVEFDKLDIDKIYLKYAVISKLNMMAGLVHGATMKHIVKKDFDNTCIPYPPINEQKDIVSELDKINELISLKKAQLGDLDALAQSLFYDKFGDPTKNEKGWEVKNWSDVLTIINGKNQKAVECNDGDYPIYGSGGIMSYANNWLCPEDCIVIGRKGNINKPIFVHTKFWNVDTAFGLDAKRDILSPTYLYFFCIDYDFERLNKAVTIPSLTKADLLKISMPVPSLSLQRDFAKRIEVIEQQKEQISSTIKDLETLLASRMQYWFD